MEMITEASRVVVRKPALASFILSICSPSLFRLQSLVSPGLTKSGISKTLRGTRWATSRECAGLAGCPVAHAAALESGRT